MKTKRYCLIIMFVLITNGMCLCAQSALSSPESGVETTLNMQQLTETAVPLQSLKHEFQEENTMYSYLTEIEEELIAFEKQVAEKKAQEKEVYLLEDCIELATERHLPIEIARDKISLARRRLFKAIRDLFPGMTIYYEHDIGFKLLKADTVPGDHSNQNFRSEKWRASLSQPIFQGGALVNKVREERATLRMAKAEYDKVFLDLLVEVARAYFNYSKAKTMLSYKEDLVATANELLRLSEEKMSAALISEIEHLNVQSQQSQIAHDLEAAKEDIALALLDVQKALHLDVTEPIDVAMLDGAYQDVIKKEVEKAADDKQDKTEQDDRKLNELVDLAYAHRPEFIIQKSKLDSALYREKVAQAGWFPQANVQVERGQKAEAYIEDDNNPTWDEEHRIVLDTKWNLYGNTVRYVYDKNKQGTGVEATEPNLIGIDGYYDRKNMISVSILDGLDQFAQTKEAEIRRKEALLELELSEKDIIGEVKESYYNYNRALIQLKSVYKRLAYRKKLVELAKHRSEINEIQISEYIQSRIDLINEYDTLYRASVDYFLAKVSLNKSIGIKDYFNVTGANKERPSNTAV